MSGGRVETTRALVFCLAAAWFAAPAAAADALRPFVSGSYAEILAAYRDRPFLLVFWSVECPPCYGELDMLAEVRREHPRLPLVVIATDTEEASQEVLDVLGERGLAGADAWVFGAGAPERLRFEVDPAWYGEVPRSYFYDRAHERKGLSGRLQRASVEAWLAANFP